MKRITFRPRDLAASGLIIATGALTILEALRYGLGTPTNMGPGFFPMGIGILLVIMGIGIGVFDARAPLPSGYEQPRLSADAIRPLILLPISILVFAAIVPRFGLAPATFGAVFTSAFADRRVSALGSLATALGVTVLCVVIFRLFLDLQVRTFLWAI